MGKKKIDLKFRLELELDNGITITKEFMKNYMESKAKGLKVLSIPVFKVEKNSVFAELETNLHKILFIEKAIEEAKSSSEVITGDSISQELLDNSKLLVSQFMAQEISNPELYKIASMIESQAASTNELVRQLNSQSAYVPTSYKDGSIEYKKIIEDMNKDLKRLSEENDKLKSSEHFGDKVLLERIQKLEGENERKQAIHEEIKEELDNRIQQLCMEILDKDDQIAELKASLEGKGNMGKYIDGYKEAQVKMKALESSYDSLNEEIKGLKKSYEGVTTENRKLTGNLAMSLEELSKFEKSTVAKEYRLKKLTQQKNKVNIEMSKLQEMLQGQLVTVAKYIETCCKGIAGTSEKVRKLKNYLNEVRAQLETIRNKFNTTEQELTKAEEIKKMQESLIKAKETEASKMQKSITDMDSSNKSYERQIQILEQEKKSLLEKLAATLNEFQLAKNQIGSLEQVVTIQIASKKNTKKVVERLQSSVSAQYLAQFKKMTGLVVPMYERALKLLPRVKQMSTVQKATRDSVKSLTKQAEMAASEIQSLKNQVTTLTKANKDSQQRIAEYEKLKATLNEQIAGYKDKVAELTAKANENEASIKKCKEEIVQKDDQYKTLNEVYMKMVEVESQVKNDAFEANSREKTTSDRLTKLHQNMQKGKAYAKEVIKKLIDRMSALMKQLGDREAFAIKKVTELLPKITHNEMNLIKKLKQTLKLTKERVSTQEKALRLEQEKMRSLIEQFKANCNRIKDAMILKEGNINLKILTCVASNVRVILRTIKKSSEDARNSHIKVRTINNERLIQSKSQIDELRKHLKDLRIDSKEKCRKLEDIGAKKAKQIFASLSLMASNRTNVIMAKFAKTIERLKGVNSLLGMIRTNERTLKAELEKNMKDMRSKEQAAGLRIKELTEKVLQSESYTQKAVKELATVKEVLKSEQEKLEKASAEIDTCKKCIVEKDKVIADERRVMAEREKDVADRDKLLNDNKTFIAENDKVLKGKDKEIMHCKKMITEKDKAIAEDSKTIGEMKKLMTEKDAHLKEREKAIAEKEKTINENKNLLVTKEKLIVDHASSITEKDRIIGDKDKSINDLKKTITEKDQSIVDKEAKAKKLMENHEKMKKDLEERLQTIQKLLGTEKEESAKYKKMAESNELTIKTTSQEYGREKTELNSKLGTAQAQVQEFKDKLGKAETHAKDIQQQLDTKIKEITEKERTFNTSTQEYAKTKKELEEEKTKLIAELENNKKRLSELEKELKSEKANHLKTMEEKDSAAAKTTERMNIEITTLTTQTASQAGHIQKLTTELSDSEAKLNEQKLELKKTIESYEDKVNECNKKHEVAVTAMQSKLSESEVQLQSADKDFRNKKEEMEQKITKLKNDLAASARLAEEEKGEIERVSQEKDKLKNELDDLNKNYNTLQIEHTQLKEQSQADIQNQISTLTQKETAISQFKERNKELQEKLAKLESDYEVLKTQHKEMETKLNEELKEALQSKEKMAKELTDKINFEKKEVEKHEETIKAQSLDIEKLKQTEREASEKARNTIGLLKSELAGLKSVHDSSLSEDTQRELQQKQSIKASLYSASEKFSQKLPTLVNVTSKNMEKASDLERKLNILKDRFEELKKHTSNQADDSKKQIADLVQNSNTMKANHDTKIKELTNQYNEEKEGLETTYKNTIEELNNRISKMKEKQINWKALISKRITSVNNDFKKLLETAIENIIRENKLASEVEQKLIQLKQTLANKSQNEFNRNKTNIETINTFTKELKDKDATLLTIKKQLEEAMASAAQSTRSISEESKAEIDKLNVEHKNSIAKTVKQLTDEKEESLKSLNEEHKKTVEGLNKKLEDFKDSVSNAERTIKEKEATLLELVEKHKNDLSEKEQTMSRLQEDHKKGLETLMSGSSQKLDQIAQLKDEEIAKLKTTVEKLKGELTNEMDKVKKLEESITAKENIIEMRVKENEALKLEISKEKSNSESSSKDIEEATRKLDQTIKDKEQEIVKLTSENEESKKKLEGALTEKDATMAKITGQHVKETESYMQQITGLEEIKKTLEQRANEKEQEIAQLNENYKKDIEALSIQTSQNLNTIVAEKDKEIEGLTKQIAGLEQTVKDDTKADKKESEEQKQKLEKALNEKDKAIEKIIELHAKETESYMEQISKLESLKNKQEKTILEQEQSINKLTEDHKNDINNLNKKISEVENEKANLTKLINTAASDKDQALVKANDDNQKKLHKLTQDLKNAESAVQKSEQLAQEKTQALNKLESKLKDIEKANKKLESSLSKGDSAHKKDLESVKHKLAEKEKLIADHKKDSEKLLHTISEQKKELDKLKKDHADAQAALSKTSGADQQYIELIRKKEKDLADSKEAQEMYLAELKRQIAMMTDEAIIQQDVHNKFKTESTKIIQELTEKNKALEARSQGATTSKSMDISQLKGLQTLIKAFHKELMILVEVLKSNFTKMSLKNVLPQLREILSKTSASFSSASTSETSSQQSSDEKKPDGKVKLIREILYLCKIFSNVEKEKITIFEGKTKRLDVLNLARNELLDPKIQKDSSKQKAAIAKHIENFPYLKAFNAKNDIAFVFVCMAKLAEWKIGKLKKYQDETKNCVARLNITENSVKTYEKKLAELQKT